MTSIFTSLSLMLLLACSLSSCSLNLPEANGKAARVAEPPKGLLKAGTLDPEIQESSGLAPTGEPGTFFTHGDAGTKPVLFKIDATGKLLQKLTLPVQNSDWESLSHDSNGNIYICDCGNNSNSRKDLVVYRLHPSKPDKIAEIHFRYQDQKDFPPKKKERNFDSEASIWHNGQLYLFSRDRGKQQNSKVYVLPAEPGNHEARLLTTLPVSGEVTSASLSPDGKRLVLLTKENLQLFEGSDLSEMLKTQPRIISTAGAGQTEGSEFLDNQTLLISTEEGVLYHYKL